MRKTKAGNFTIGIEMLLLGLLLIYSYWAGRPLDLRRSWPLLLIISALPMLVQSLTRPTRGSSGLIFGGTLFFLLGVYFLVFSLNIWGVTWDSFGIYWPFLLLIPGVSLTFVHALDSVRYNDLTHIVNILLLAGILGMIFTYRIHRGRAALAFLNHWPLLILPLAFYIFGLFVPVEGKNEE